MNGRFEGRACLVVVDDPSSESISIDTAGIVEDLFAEKPRHGFGPRLTSPVQLVNGTVRVDDRYATAGEKLGDC